MKQELYEPRRWLQCRWSKSEASASKISRAARDDIRILPLSRQSCFSAAEITAFATRLPKVEF